MADPELSAEQKAVLSHNVRVVEAGTGSGKTRALVARFIQSASESRRGVAFISFTNAAVAEVRARTCATPHLLRAPHFVGTIDAFLHRFIVTPAEVARLGRSPSYRQSWDDLPSDMSVMRLASVPGSGIRLSSFRMNQDGDVVLSPLRWPESGYLSEVDNAGRRGQLLNRAAAVMRGLIHAGTHDANTARVRAFQLLKGSDGAAIVGRLTRRFEELLVDEGQDCDEAEMGVIQRLATEIRTVVVADPDQAIYEFRGSDPQLFLAYRDEQTDQARATLATNFRSSTSICSTVNALRAAGSAELKAHDSAACAPILVLEGSVAAQRQKFVTALGDHGIDVHDAVVLAHSRTDAATAAGRAPAEGKSLAVGNQLAAACAVLKGTRSSSAERLQAIKRLEVLILGLITWPDEEIRAAGPDRQLEALKRRSDWLRQAAGHLVSRLSAISERDDFGPAARQVLTELLEPLPLPYGALGSRVKKPEVDVWSRCAEEADDAVSGIACDTIHAAKGSEFAAVLIALPVTLRKDDGRDVLEDCEQELNTEPRRVLYVAASRAQSLLAFGAGPHRQRVAALLARAGVHHECG